MNTRIRRLAALPAALAVALLTTGCAHLRDTLDRTGPEPAAEGPRLTETTRPLDPTAPDPPPSAATNETPARKVAVSKTAAPEPTRKTAARTTAVSKPAAPDPAPAPLDLGQIDGGRHLAGLHPEVRRMAEALYTEARARGIEIRFISGHRAFDPHSARARQGRASWHNFGMAFDLNLARHRTMKAALAHYDADGDDWETLGAIGEALGLTWGRAWGRHEVFHFEWHPGMKAAIRRPQLDALLADAGPDGRDYKKTWRRFRPAPPTDGLPETLADGRAPDREGGID